MVGMCFKQNLSNIEKVFSRCDGIRDILFYILVCDGTATSRVALFRPRKWMITVHNLNFPLSILLCFVMKYTGTTLQAAEKKICTGNTYVTWLAKYFLIERTGKS